MECPEKYEKVIVTTYHSLSGSVFPLVRTYVFYNTSIFDAQLEAIATGVFKETPWWKIFSKKNIMFIKSGVPFPEWAEEWVYKNKNEFYRVW